MQRIPESTYLDSLIKTCMFKTRKSYCGGRFHLASLTAFLKKKAILRCSRADAGKTEAW